MVDFFNTLEGKTFIAQIKNLGKTLGEYVDILKQKETPEEKMARSIYSQLVTIDFFRETNDILSYEELKSKAKEAAKEYFT